MKGEKLSGMNLLIDIKQLIIIIEMMERGVNRYIEDRKNAGN